MRKLRLRCSNIETQNNGDFIILLKIYLQNDINLVEAIIKNQKLRLACRESPRYYATCKNQVELLTLGVIFEVTRYKGFLKNKNVIKTF